MHVSGQNIQSWHRHAFKCAVSKTEHFEHSAVPKIELLKSSA